MAHSEWSESAPGRKYLKQRRGSTWYVFKSGDDKWSLKTSDYEEACLRYDSADLHQERPADGLITCEQAWAIFIEKHPVADSTRARYASVWENWGSPRLGRKRVASVTVADITDVYRAAQRKGRTHDNIHRALSSFFKTCTEGETRYRPDSPVASVAKEWRPKFESGLVDGDVVVISDEKIEEMAGLAEVAGNPLRRDERMGAIQLGALIRLMPLLGCRVSEFLALELTDLRLDPSGEQRFDELHIERQLSFEVKAGREETWFKNTKGRKGTIGSATRVVTVSASADAVLGEYIDLGTREGWLKPGGLLFPNEKGRPRSPGHVISKVTELHKLVGNQATGTHCFRHTAASNWLAAGMVMQDIADMLGHDVDVCAKRYALLQDRSSTNARRRALMNRTLAQPQGSRRPAVAGASSQRGTQVVVDLAQAKGLRDKR